MMGAANASRKPKDDGLYMLMFAKLNLNLVTLIVAARCIIHGTTLSSTRSPARAVLTSVNQLHNSNINFLSFQTRNVVQCLFKKDIKIREKSTTRHENQPS
jgi:hypothetical protein